MTLVPGSVLKRQKPRTPGKAEPRLDFGNPGWRRELGLLKPKAERGDQADQAAAENHRTIDVSKVLQLLRSEDESVIRKVQLRLHVKWYHAETERLQSLLRAAGVLPKACNLVPQVIQSCQVCRPWRKPGQNNKLPYSLALSFNEGVQFDLIFYHSRLEPGLGGAHGIPVLHFIDCCIRLSARIKSQSKSTRDLLDGISLAWVNVFGGVQTLILDGETGMRGRAVDAWAIYNQITLKYKAPHQKAWLVERHDALIRSAVQRAESQVIKESFCISFTIVLGVVTFLHNALVCINQHTPYQALLGRQPHLLPPLEGGYHGDLDVKGQNNLARVREIVAIAITEATAKQRLQRGAKGNQVGAIERAEHHPGDLVDIWYHSKSGAI